MARSSLAYIPGFSVKFFFRRAGLSDTILKGNHPETIPARFGLIWFSGFRGEDLNVIFYQNMPNLHNRYISCMTGFFMNFELLPILTDYAN
jgi:hypothetical protein